MHITVNMAPEEGKGGGISEEVMLKWIIICYPLWVHLQGENALVLLTWAFGSPWNPLSLCVTSITWLLEPAYANGSHLCGLKLYWPHAQVGT